uniref:Uncharacterized protein n=1 Tax=Anguilla anguilla TaxID=7936 RepID=A0A0E9S9K5_ANGAN
MARDFEKAAWSAGNERLPRQPALFYAPPT